VKSFHIMIDSKLAKASDDPVRYVCKEIGLFGGDQLRELLSESPAIKITIEEAKIEEGKK